MSVANDELETFHLQNDPFVSFEAWFQDAVSAGVAMAEAMTLATATRKGRVSARLVLYKGWSRGGLVFYTNYHSPKARDLVTNPQAAAVFYWPERERQIRIAGGVRKLPRKESQAYFASRPRDSQLGAWASAQSSPIHSREELDESFAAVAKKYDGAVIPCPAHWGGFRLIPFEFEFWQGQKARLHDRFLYEKKGRSWRVTRLFP